MRGGAIAAARRRLASGLRGLADALAPADPAGETDELAIPVRLETRTPDDQNAVDLFGQQWVMCLEDRRPRLRSGHKHLLREDRRPFNAARHLGFTPGSLEGMRVLELGPMEGAHTFLLTELGAEVLAIEANSHAYLRALVAKEILGTRNCRFLLGDALAHLREDETRYDLIFCSGVLYHMEDPFRLIEAMAGRTDRIFLSTHYFDPEFPTGPACRPERVTREGLELTYHRHAYDWDLRKASFWGGVAPVASWLSREDILRAFRHFGFEITVQYENRELDVGFLLTATAVRPT